MAPERFLLQRSCCTGSELGCGRVVVANEHQRGFFLGRRHRRTMRFNVMPHKRVLPAGAELGVNSYSGMRKLSARLSEV